MVNDAFQVYNSFSDIDLNVLIDNTMGNQQNVARNVCLIGFLKGFCEPPEVKDLRLRYRKTRYGVLSLIGVVCNCNAQNSNDLVYGKAAGDVLIVVPPQLVNAYSTTNKPFLAVGSVIRKNNFNSNMVQSFKFNKDESGWTVEPNYTVELFKNTSNGIEPTKIKLMSGYADLSMFYAPLMYLKGRNYRSYEIKKSGYHAASEGCNFFMSDEFSLQQEVERENREKEIANAPDVGGEPTGTVTLPQAPNILGVSNDTSWNNRINSGDNKPFVVTSRDSLKPRSKYADYLATSLKDAKSKVQDILNTMDEYNGIYDIEGAIEHTGSALKAHWNKKGDNTKKGVDYFLEAVARVDDMIAADGMDSALGREILVKKEGIIDYWVDAEIDLDSKSSDKSDVYSVLANNRHEIYYALIERILGVNGLVDACSVAGEEYDMYSILCKNPYYLCLIDARIDIKSLDILAMLYGVDKTDANVKRLRNIAFMHNLMLSTERDGVLGGDTVATRSQVLYKMKMQYKVGKRVYDNISEYGSILIPSRQVDVQTYISDVATDKRLCYEESELKLVTWGNISDYYCVIAGSKEDALNDYINSGVGLLLTMDNVKYVTDFVLAKKEDYIYRKIYELASYESDIDVPESLIDSTIKSFETSRGFTLEPLQADAVRLLKHMAVCLTGPAGSGKTTTAEAILFAIQNILGVEDDEILFCAPTGKAANRLREVVKKPTGTIHSKYRIVGDDMSLRDASDAKKDDNNVSVLICDESSMITVDLMYNMLRKVDKGTRLYFLGDIEQLPPIGFGKPFANLLSFLPCVKLEVSKRASEKSLINYNAKVIINNSGDGTAFFPLKSGADFKLIQADVADSVAITNKLIRWHLGLTNVVPVSNNDLISALPNLNPDDIQIISPFSAKSKASSTANLNNLVQDSFNPRIKNQMVYRFAKDRKGEDVTEFRLNDRVINNKNNATKTCYVETSDGFKKLREGIMNGDVGKIVGFYSPDTIKLVEDDDNFKGSDKTIFIGVKFESVDDDGLECEFVCFYRTVELLTQGNDVTVAYTPDLRVLDLAYALTVHKLQGSQAKLVLFICAEGTPSFICRNLIYTAITRAKEGVYILGDVQDTHSRKSLLTLGRKNETANSRVSIMDKLQ